MAPLAPDRAGGNVAKQKREIVVRAPLGPHQGTGLEPRLLLLVLSLVLVLVAILILIIALALTGLSLRQLLKQLATLVLNSKKKL